MQNRQHPKTCFCVNYNIEMERGSGVLFFSLKCGTIVTLVAPFVDSSQIFFSLVWFEKK